jgi:alkylated DNA repair protein (DNA oxidative demethylase)
MTEPAPAPVDLNGVLVWPGRLPPAAQAALVDDLRTIARAAPFLRPETPRGQPMSVRMTSAGRLGWIADRRGYRYAPRHPSGVPWPPIPAAVLRLWHEVTGLAREPDCCLINFYGEGARMGLHQDRDEGDFSFPVLSVSLGDAALFRVGGSDRRAPTRSLWLGSGDVALMAGPARLAFHGIDRIRFGSSGLLPGGGRISLTLRVVAPPRVAPAGAAG